MVYRLINHAGFWQNTRRILGLGWEFPRQLKLKCKYGVKNNGFGNSHGRNFVLPYQVFKRNHE